MNARLRLAAIVAPIGLLLVAASLYFIDVAIHRDAVPRGVVAGEVALGGLTPSEAVLALEELDEEIASLELTIRVDDATTDVAPRDLGLSLDVEGMVDQAMGVGRDGSTLEEFRRWISSLSTPTEIPLSVVTDEQVMASTLRAVSTDLVGAPPFDGSVGFVDGAVRTETPRAGLTIDAATAQPLLESAFLTTPRGEVVLSVVPTPPRLTTEHIEAARREAERLLGGPVTLVVPEQSEVPADEEDADDVDDPEGPGTGALPRLTEFVYSVEDLGAALVTEIVPVGDGFRMDVALDPTILAERILPLSDQLAVPPVNAELAFDEESSLASINPSRPGQRIDVTALEPVVRDAASTPSRTAELPLIDGADPEVTTEDLEALDIRHMVSSFTTYHDCCQDRVTNIQKMADSVNGTIVLPGEEFSLNAVVGERTTEKGYLPAGTIVAGALEDTVGGGVSQFSTTLYNAVYWGGYEDVSHTPHSIYFSRYPEGIEATLNWPDLHNIWRNDSESAVVVRTRYTSTSITVELWGNNDGRILWGDHWRGRTEIEVRAEGGPNARVVSSSVTGRFSERDPEPEYAPDDTIKPGASVIDDDGRVGWSVGVTRTIAQGDDAWVDEWTVRYSPQPILTRVHSCMLDGDGTSLLPEEAWTLACPENLPPIVSVSGPGSATAGTPITLSVTAVDDWDEQVTIAWSGADSFSAPAGLTTQVTFAAAGSYVVTVTATDLDGNAAQATIEIVVTDP